MLAGSGWLAAPKAPRKELVGRRLWLMSMLWYRRLPADPVLGPPELVLELVVVVVVGLALAAGVGAVLTGRLGGGRGMAMPCHRKDTGTDVTTASGVLCTVL